MSLRKLDIDDFLIMSLLAKRHSVTKTAKLLHLTQPAISQRIKKIEEVFETKLLDKRHKIAVLTAEAENIAYSLLCGLELISATMPDSLGDRWSDPLINYVLTEPSDRPASECN